ASQSIDSLHRSVIGRDHEHIVDLYVDLHFRSRLDPFGLGPERRPRLVPRLGVLISQDVDQLVGLGDGLPESNDRHPVLLEERIRVVAETGVQEVDRTAFPYGVGSQLEAARVLCPVLDNNPQVWPARSRGRRWTAPSRRRCSLTGWRRLSRTG